MRIEYGLIGLNLFLASLLAATSCTAQDDTEFVRQAASTGMLEVELGNYAAMNAEDPGVKRFGRTMADEHGQANQELELLAQRQGIRIQSGMTPEHREEATKLMKLHGADFDKAYVDAMVDGHEDAVDAFSAQAKQDRSDVDRWAAATLPKLRQHLDHARELKKSEDERVSVR